jgi:hypothetical protein
MATSTRPRPDQAIRDAVTKRILAHARKHWPDTEVLVRHDPWWHLFRSNPEPERETFTPPRQRYRGDGDHWLVGIYKASTQSFGQDELPTRFSPLITTPEQAMDHVLGFWVHPPAET